MTWDFTDDLLCKETMDNSHPTTVDGHVHLVQLQICASSMIGFASLFVAARVVVQFLHPRRLALEDILMVPAYTCFLAMTVCYMWIAPILYRLAETRTEALPHYPEEHDDAVKIIKTFFVTTILFWAALWFVKGSLLAMYRRLLGSYPIYNWVMTGVTVFCVLAFFGCITSQFLACSSLEAWFEPGKCMTPRDHKAQMASLFYSFSADVLTNLMIMALPVALLWNLRVSLGKKVGIMTLFCVGGFAIIAAIARLISIATWASNASLSAIWFAFWGIIESGIAVIVGTTPGLYTATRQVYNSWKESRSTEHISLQGQRTPSCGAKSAMEV